MAKRKDELTVHESNASALQVSPLLMEQLDGLQGDGFENVTAEDMALPIINVLQSISPQCDKKNKEYDPSVTEGEFYNSVSKSSVESLTVIPIGFTKAYVEWKPRASGGGFVARYSAGHPRISQAQAVGTKLVLENGNELVQTAEHYVMVIPEDGAPFVALLPLKGTQIKHSKRFVNEMTTKVITRPDGSTKRAPMPSQTYKLTTGIESNAHGSWYGLTGIDYQGFVQDANILSAAIAAFNSFSNTLGKVDQSYEKVAPATGANADIDAAVAATME